MLFQWKVSWLHVPTAPVVFPPLCYTLADTLQYIYMDVIPLVLVSELRRIQLNCHCCCQLVSVRHSVRASLARRSVTNQILTSIFYSPIYTTQKWVGIWMHICMCILGKRQLKGVALFLMFDSIDYQALVTAVCQLRGGRAWKWIAISNVKQESELCFSLKI